MEEQVMVEVFDSENMQSNDFDDELMFLYDVPSTEEVDIPEWIDHTEHVPCPKILAESQTKPPKRKLESKEDSYEKPLKKALPEWQPEMDFFEGPLSIIPPEWEPDTKLSSPEILEKIRIPKWVPDTKPVPKIPDVKPEDCKCSVKKTDSPVKTDHPAKKSGYSCQCVECVGPIQTVDPKLSIKDSEILGSQCYLENTILGQCFKLYRLNGNKMSDELRECLANCLIELELERVAQKHDVSPQEMLANFTISTEIFVEMSSQIENTFLGENKFAYFTSGSSQGESPKGFLWTEYCKKVQLANKKPDSELKQPQEECLIEPPPVVHPQQVCLIEEPPLVVHPQQVCLIEEPPLVVPPQQESFVEPTSLIQPPVECLLEPPIQSIGLGNTLLDSEDIIWLHEMSEPFEEVVVRWQRSYNLRRALFDQGYFTPQQYFNYFLCLQAPYAVDLLVHDFVTRYPNMSEHMKLRWDVIKKAIASQLERTQVKEAGTRLLASIFPTCPTLEQDRLAMFFLPYFVQNRRSRRSGVTRSTSVNNVGSRRAAFYLNIEDPSKLQETLEKVRKERFEKSTLIQPLIVMVNALPESTELHVLWNDMLISVPSCVEAIDLTFKITTALNLPFPELAKETWMVIQKCGYSISTSEHRSKSFDSFVDCFREEYCKIYN